MATESFLGKIKTEYVDSNIETRNLAVKWGNLGIAAGFFGVPIGFLLAKVAYLAAGVDQAQITILGDEGAQQKRNEQGKSFWTGFKLFRKGGERVKQPTLRTALIGI